MTRIARALVVAGVVAAVAAVALITSGCGDSPRPAKSGNAANSSITIFNGSTGTIVENWNPFSPTFLQPTEGVIYEPLYWYNLATQAAPKPMLATAYKWSPDGKQLTITTRTGVTWTDGQPFSAKDVAYTFDLIRRTKAINATGLQITSAQATDDHTVVLTFPEKSFTAEASIIGNTPIIAEHIWSKISDPAKSINPQPVGTGPYKLVSTDVQQKSWDLRPDWWAATTGFRPLPQIQRLTFLPGMNEITMAQMLIANQIDIKQRDQ